MITTRFIGRLGNSMFQIAAIIAYARKYGYQWGVPPDQRESCILTYWGDRLPKCYERYPDQPRHAYDPQWFNYWDIPNYGDNITLAGYFQSDRFFANVQDEVKELFALDHVSAYEGKASIHIRRGDYVQHAASFPPITIEYMNQAMQYIADKTGVKDFVVFSDDVQYCRTLDYRFNVNFVEGLNEKDSLSIMASCSHHIIANSTFSWWGAYLGHNPDRVIVSPSSRNWFGPTNPNYCPKDIIPENWHQIEW